jgi:phospholipid N-methyltransferase
LKAEKNLAWQRIDSMARRLTEYGLFLKEFWRNYHTTGAILPSGRWLADALARYVTPSNTPRKILEVGPGTGPVTRCIAWKMGQADKLDLVELNDAFVEQLRHAMTVEPGLQRVAPRTRIMHCAIQSLPAEPTYDVIISGLPLNNFSVELVDEILKTLWGLLKPGGTLSFFEYIAIRYAKTLVSGRAERTRLRGISRVLQSVLGPHEIRRDWVWPNIPPAWVHHVQKP